MEIIDLKRLTKNDLDNNDLLFIQDISEGETKNIKLPDFTDYVISSSTILTTLRTGSFTGSFFGELIGNVNSSSYSEKSYQSNQTFYLSNDETSNNSSSSFSINSSSSLFSYSSSLSVTSSLNTSASNSSYAFYVDTLTVKKGDNATSASNAVSSNYSNATYYINYNGNDNGTSLRSITSDDCLNTQISKNIINNNVSTSSLSITSSHALQSLSSSYINKTEYADRSDRTSFTSKSIYAYITFKIKDINEGIEIYSWKNIRTNNPIIIKKVEGILLFYIYFDQPFPEGRITTVVGDWNVSRNGIFYSGGQPSNSDIYNPVFFPNKHFGMVTGIASVHAKNEGSWIFGSADVGKYKTPIGQLPIILQDSTFSVIAYATKFNSPIKQPGIKKLETTTLGCASL